MCEKNRTPRTSTTNLFRALVCAFALVPAISVHAASSYEWKNVQIVGGGFIPGIVFNNSQKDLIYARTDIGGPYRWDPANRKWIPLTDFVSPEDWNLMGCDALATDPVDPNRVYVLAGDYTNDWTSQNGAILRSADQGSTWQRTNLPFKVGGNMPGRSMGERLMIDPNKNNILYLGARSGNGLWKSTDFGATWAKVSTFPNPGTYAQSPGAAYGGDAMGIAWITFDKSTGSLGSETKTIYVGVADKGNSIYRSTDGGATWAAVAGQPKGYLPHHGVLSSKGMLYVAYSDSVGPYDGVKGEVWKFNTATGAWTNISPVPSSSSDDYFGYGGLAVDAQHPDTLMVATMNSWWPDANIFRSVDGGATWTRIWEWTSYPSRSLRYTQDISASPWLSMGKMDNPPEPAVKLGWMMGSLEIDPFNSDRMMYGTGATLYGADNLTAWDSGGKVDIKVMAQGIEETAILALISPPEGAHLLSGLGDISGFRHDDLEKVPEKVMMSPTFSSTRGMDYAELSPSFIVRVGDGDHTSGFSYDGGSSWFQGNSEPANDKLGGSVAAAADASVVLRSVDSAGVFYSKDNGNSWTGSSGVPAKAVIASDRVNAKKFYAYSAGTVYRSTDGGASFTKTAATGLASDAYCQLKAMPAKEGDLWLACGKAGLWHSTDSGGSIGKLTGVVDGHAIGFGKAGPGKTTMTLYASAKIGQVTGIYRSDDGGAAWTRINDDQHQYGTVVNVITGDPRIYGRVYFGARGIVYGDGDAGTTPPPPPSVIDSTLNRSTASFDKKSGSQADVAVTMTLNGNTLSAIKNGSAALVAGTDYSVSGNTVTLLKSYLAKQAVGTTTLTFDFSAGADPSLSVTISDTTAAAIPVTGVTVSPTQLTLNGSTPGQLTATVAPGNATNKTVTWTSSNPGVATVSAIGQVTGISDGTATITATATGQNGKLTATSAITVSTSASQSPTMTLAAAAGNGKIALSWTVAGDIKSIQVMRDTDADPAGRQRVAILNGKARSYTDTTVVNGRQYWYWIKYTDAAGKAGNSNAGSATAGDSTQPIAVTSVAVSPASVSVTTGATMSLSATVLPANATNKTLIWRSSNAGVATVSATGVVTGVTVGNATIIATSADGNRNASSTVTVAAADNGSNGNTDTGSCVTSAALPLVINSAGEFCRVTSGEISNINSWNTDLVEINGVAYTNQWSNKMPAKVDGKYTIRYVGKYPWSHLEVNGTGGNTQPDIIAVTGVAVAPTSATVKAGASTSLSATVAPNNATNKSVTWSSSDTSIATVNSNGVVAGVSAGSATITATTADGKRTATSAITVTGGGAALTWRGVSLSSAEFGEQHLPGTYNTDYTYPSANEAAYFATKGMNIVRLPFRWERLQPALNQPLDAVELGRLKGLVDAVTATGTAVQLDPHNYARYGTQQDNVIGGATVPISAFADFWSRLASQFKNNPKVVFGLMNEPHDIVTETWVTAANAAIAAIRTTGATNTITVPGVAWTGAWSWTNGNFYGTANGVAMLKITDSGNNLLFEVHQYLDSDSSGTSSTCVSSTIGSERLASFTAWLKANGRRGLLGEIGADSNPVCSQAVADALNHLKANADVWAGWVWWAAGPWWYNPGTGTDSFMSIEPSWQNNNWVSGAAVTDKPQMKVLAPYLAP
jgi:xyloglucan-specific exo-beta-1,4-glucanase